MIVADAARWTGRRPWVEIVREATLAALRRNGAGVLAPEDAPWFYAMLAETARRAGLPMPVVVVDPKFTVAAAQAIPPLEMIRFSPRALTFPQVVQASLIAHEMGHFVAGHGMTPDYIGQWLKPVSWVAVAAALALGDLALILAAVIAFILADLALRRFMARIEEEADRQAARLLGSVAALLASAERSRSIPVRWIDRATLWLGGYPLRRPWLDRIAAEEVLADFERVMAPARDTQAMQ